MYIYIRIYSPSCQSWESRKPFATSPPWPYIPRPLPHTFWFNTCVRLIVAFRCSIIVLRIVKTIQASQMDLRIGVKGNCLLHSIIEITIRKFLIQVGLGLQWLHSNRILHRDIKTLNVFLTINDDARLMHIILEVFCEIPLFRVRVWHANASHVQISSNVAMSTQSIVH